MYYRSIVIIRKDFLAHVFLLHAFKHVITCGFFPVWVCLFVPYFFTSGHSAVNAYNSPHVLFKQGVLTSSATAKFCTQEIKDMLFHRVFQVELSTLYPACFRAGRLTPPGNPSRYAPDMTAGLLPFTASQCAICV